MSLYACVVIQPQGAPCVARLVMQASPTSAPSCAVHVDHKKTKRKRFRARKTPDEMRKHALHALERCVRLFRSSLKSSTSRSPSPAPRCSFLLQTRARAVYRCCMRGLVERYQRFHQSFRCRVCQFTKVLNGARHFLIVLDAAPIHCYFLSIYDAERTAGQAVERARQQIPPTTGAHEPQT